MKQKQLYLAGIIVTFIVSGIAMAKGVVTFDSWRIKKSEELLTRSQKVTNNQEKLVLLQEAAFWSPNEETYLKTGIFAAQAGDNELADTYLERVKTANGFFQLGNNYFQLKQFQKAKDTYAKAINKAEKPEYLLGRAKSELQLVELGQAKTDLQKAKTLNGGSEAEFWLYLTDALEQTNPVRPKVTSEFATDVDKIAAYGDPANHANVVFNELNTQNYPQLAIWYLKQQYGKGNLNRDGLLVLAKYDLSVNDYSAEYDTLLKAKSQDPYYPQTYQQLAAAANKLGKADEAKQYLDFYNKLNP